MRVMLVLLPLALTVGCVVPPELREARDRLSRLDAELGETRASLEEARGSLSEAIGEQKATQDRIDALKASLDEPGASNEELEALRRELQVEEEKRRAADEMRQRAEAELQAKAAVLSATERAREAAAESERRWKAYADDLLAAKVESGVKTAVKIGDGVVGGLLPFLQSLFPGLGLLSGLAGAWKGLKKGAVNG